MISREKECPVPELKAFHKPADLPAALALLARPHPRTVPLAGGTWLVPRLGKEVQAEAVVDLSDLGLEGIDSDPDTLRIGAMTTLAAVSEDRTCHTLAYGILAESARRAAAVNVRNQATVGGTIVVAPIASEFILALLALDAELSISGNGFHTWSLAKFLQEPGPALADGLIAQIRVHLPMQAAGGLARVARTPSDHPIVAAAAVIAEDADAIRVVLGGVASRPLQITLGQLGDAEEELCKAIESADPYGDWRGSAEYRREMGRLLALRALEHAVAQR
jgi:CO/xanthine dehydrogenase FAD-binding subunit